MSFAIQIVPSALEELKVIRAFERRRIVQAIDAQLADQPMVETKNRKQLGVVPTSFESEPPIWELRVGSYRIFYDVDQDESTVYVRAIREKTPRETTEEIL